MKNRKLTVACAAIIGAGLFVPANPSHADEQLFGYVRGAETLPKNKWELYQFMTMRTGKDEGSYFGFDFETEAEYGITDQWQASVAVEQRYINNHGVNGDRDELDDLNSYKFGGLMGSTKYRLLSPFKDPVGLAVRLEGGYLWNDEVGGLPEHELYLAPEIDLQKNFLDDTLITEAWMGPEWAWGKQPAEEYPREISFQGGAGISYRFAPNWFIGIEGNARAEYPMFNVNHFEHAALYAGPALHYSSKRWWVTVSYVYQAWGSGIDELHDGKTYAEETDHKVRMKVGFNF